jgi:hypothetical protein
MKAGRGWAIAMLLVWVAGGGCTALREIPRGEYAVRVHDRPIRVVTREGLSYELDTASIQADTLVGYRRKDVEGPIDEFFTLRVPLADVATISARRIDWYRTSLVGGLSVAAVVAAGAARHNSNGGSSGTPPCPEGRVCP